MIYGEEGQFFGLRLATAPALVSPRQTTGSTQTLRETDSQGTAVVDEIDPHPRAIGGGITLYVA